MISKLRLLLDTEVDLLFNTELLRALIRGLVPAHESLQAHDKGVQELRIRDI